MKINQFKALLILTFTLLFFLFFTKNVSAKENYCDQEPCFVPAPTIISPSNQATSTNPRPVITGLTWKTTKVSVYIDGVKLNNLKQVKHEDYYGSFYVMPDYDLKPGKHVIYAYAESENDDWGGKSKSSYYTHYNLVITTKSLNKHSERPNILSKEKIGENLDTATTTSNKIIDVNKDDHMLNEAPVDNSENTPTVKDGFVNKTEVKVIETDNQGVFSVNDKMVGGKVSVTSTTNQQLSGGTQEINENPEASGDSKFLQPAATKEEVGEQLKSQGNKTIEDYQQRLKTNRLVGFIILAGIALISLIWLLLKEPVVLKKEKDGIEDNNDDSDINSSRGV